MKNPKNYSTSEAKRTRRPTLHRIPTLRALNSGVTPLVRHDLTNLHSAHEFLRALEFNLAQHHTRQLDLHRFCAPWLAKPLARKPDNLRGIAAAMVLIYWRGNEPYFVLTERGSWMELCPGRIEFPGGTWDRNESFASAALRETSEELGIDHEAIQLLGELHPVHNVESNFWVRIYVGWMPKRPNFSPQADEIGAIHEVPLQELITDRCLTNVTIKHGAGVLNIPAFVFEHLQVWGGAAITLGELRQVL